MRRTSFEDVNCSVAQCLEVIGDWWTMIVIRDVFMGVNRFDELQARTGMTIKMLGDREQAQAIEAGDTIEILRRALPPEAMPVLLTTMRQATERGCTPPK